MTTPQAIGFWANMPRLRAKRIREAAYQNGTRLSAEQVYDLILSETGDEAKASRAMSDHIAATLRAGQEVE